MAVTHSKLQIDVNEKINSIVTAVAQDTKSRYLDVSLYENGMPIDLSGHTVRIYAEKEDKTVSYNQGEVTDAKNGRCQFEMTNQMLAVAGNLKVQISIWGGNSEILSTAPFIIYIIPSLRDDEALESTNEYGAVTLLFTEIQDALYLMEEITGTFGLPGSMAAGYGVDTFWGMLEHVAAGADVTSAINKRVNSDTSNPLNTKMDSQFSSLRTLVTGGNIPVVKHMQRGVATVARAEKSVDVSLSGFTNLSKMIVLLNGMRMNNASTSSSTANHSYMYVPHVSGLSTTALTIGLDYWTIDKDKGGADGTVSYQVIELY